MEDHQILLTYLLLAAADNRGPLAIAFIDLEKAYDRIPRDRLWQVFASELDMPSDLYEGILALYRDTQAALRVDRDGPPAIFPVNIGVRQGCPASPLLFSLYFDRVHQFITH